MNTYIESIQPSASIELMKKAKDLKAQGIDVIGLAGGEPDFDTPAPIKEAAIRELEKGNTHYSVAKGIPELRKRIADKLLADNGITVDPEGVLVTPGGKMAIYLTVCACINEGDEVLILNPSWVSYPEIVKAAGGVPVYIDLPEEDDYRINREILENALTDKTKLLILNYPNNPTGRILTQEELDAVTAFVKGRDIMVISDEVYERIIYDGNRSYSPAAVKEIADQVITINGFSKSYAMTGWRLGYIAAPMPVANVISKLYSHSITCISPFIQIAALKAFDCEEEVEMMRRSYEERRDFFIGGLNKIKGISARVPEGAFYAWVKVDKNGMKSAEAAEWLLENARVAGVPGIAYGDVTDSYIRFSFANSRDDLAKVLERIREVMESDAR